MPPQLLFPIDGIDLNAIVHDRAQIEETNPQRGDMRGLDAIIWVDTKRSLILGYRDVRSDEFWVSGHIPGRPLFPGVLMIEAAAQVASFYTKRYLNWEGFIGFGGVEQCRFRQEVTPPSRLYLLGQQQWQRHGRVGCIIQGVVNGNLAFEASIIGVRM